MKVLVRADASPTSGLGHVMRTLALAQAWGRRGGNAAFAMAASLPGLDDRLTREGYEIRHLRAIPGSRDDAVLTVEAMRAVGARGVIIDGYQFDGEFQRVITMQGARLACIDDLGHAKEYHAGIIINQNLHAEAIPYRTAPGTVLLLGTRYVLLRREFWSWLDWRRPIRDNATRLLVTIGGADAQNVTGKILQTLLHGDHGLEVEVMVGAGFGHAPEIRAIAASARFPVRVRHDVDDVSALMVWADAAVSAGGTSIWELAFMQVPVLGIGRGRQEVMLLETAEGAGISRTMGVYPDIDWGRLPVMIHTLLADSGARRHMADLGRTVVDGRGGERVVEAIQEAWA